jgi:hypothetical protein
LKDCSEISSIQRAGFSVKFCARGFPHLPWDVRDAILKGLAGSSTRIAPIVLGDELF